MVNEDGGETTIQLGELHASHPGLTEVTAGSFCEAACVCLDKFHKSPAQIKVDIDGETSKHPLVWDAATQQVRNSQANDIDAARDGAYAVSLACAEKRLGLVAIARAEQGSGADWYVAAIGEGYDEWGAPDLDCPSVRRFEVTGTKQRSVQAGLNTKLSQLEDGASTIRGLAASVRFKDPIVKIGSQD